MDRHVALLRGINVGGKNSLPMKTLAAMFAKAGCKDVTTFIQSGNVVFSAPAPLAARIPKLIEKHIEQDTGLKVPVVVRSAKELEACLRKNPFLKAGCGENELHFMFLADEPGKAAVQTLDAKRSPGDEFKVVGKDIYLRLPNGVGRSKLTNAYFDAKLSTKSTIRNFRTVQKLLELANGK
jgi:uncharacterized protein (DUF1697 family)